MTGGNDGIDIDHWRCRINAQEVEVNAKNATIN
jgi:hypothetical protein